MPWVSVEPKRMSDNSYVTRFITVTDSKQVVTTYNYPDEQHIIVIENSGEADIFVTVGTEENVRISADVQRTFYGSFLSFSTFSYIGSQEVIVTSLKRPIVLSGDASEELSKISSQLGTLNNKVSANSLIEQLQNERLDAMFSQISTITIDNATLGNRVSSVSEQVTVIDNANYKLQNDVTNLSVSAVGFSTELQGFYNRVNGIETATSGISQQLNELQEEISGISVGSQGPVGPEGPQGEPGLSAYEIWLNKGNVGTQTDFLNSLKGAKGDQGDTVDETRIVSLEVKIAALEAAIAALDGNTPSPTNLLPPFTNPAWFIGADARVISETEIEINSSNAWVVVYYDVPITLGKQYRFSVGGNPNGGYVYIQNVFPDRQENINIQWAEDGSTTFTPSQSASYIRFVLTNPAAGSYLFQSPVAIELTQINNYLKQRWNIS